jgi:hypothetical protein
MRRVILESPWAGNIRKHRNYARRAVRDCLKRGDAPIASHLLFTQPGVLKDGVAHEREAGILAGLAWSEVADAAVFYADYGFSMGMLHALKRHAELGTPVEIRYLFKRERTARGQRAPMSGEYVHTMPDAGTAPHGPVSPTDPG